MYAALSQEVSINFVPYGFASVGIFLLWQTKPEIYFILHELTISQTTEDENGELHFECQHGERECAGNIVQVRHFIIVATSCAGSILQDSINTMATVVNETYHHRCNVTILCWKIFTRFHQHHGKSDHFHQKFTSCARLTRLRHYQYLWPPT